MLTRWFCPVTVLLAAVLPLVCGLMSPAFCQEAPAAAVGELETLRSLGASHASLTRSLREKRQDLQEAAGTPEEAALKEAIAGLEERRRVLEQDLMAVAAGVTLEEYEADPGKKEDLTLQQEMSRILAPILAETRKLSEKPRAVQDLQNNLDIQQRRVELAELATTSLGLRLKTLEDTDQLEDAELVALLKGMSQSWQERRDEGRSRVLALRRQLEELRAHETGFWDRFANGARAFVFSRGRNILLAVLAFVVVFFGVRLMYLYGLKMIPVPRMERLSFFRRLLGLLNQGLSVGLGVLAALAVLYASGDWLLGAVAMLVLLGILLAAKNGLSRHFEQIRMLLNLGTAREGERVLIDGVPWLIGTINFQTRLTNPCLDGPGLRLPLETLMDMTSRPFAANEPWFPCRSGDHILLDGDVLARVERTGPDLVEVCYRGGMLRQIPTPMFLTMQLANLSSGFAVYSKLRLDYKLQPDITSRIPKTLREDLHAGLLKSLPEAYLLDVNVELSEAAASSLELWMNARFSGEAAALYPDLRRLLQKLAVESCTAHGWPIPYPQMVLHRPAE